MRKYFGYSQNTTAPLYLQAAYCAMQPWKISNLPERNSTSSCDLEKNLVGAKVFLIYVSVSTSEINARKELSDQAVKGIKVLKCAPIR